MRRFLGLYLILFFSHLYLRSVISFFGFNHVDGRFHVYVQLFLVPLLQSLALWWLFAGFDLRGSLRAWSQAARQPIAAFSLLLDVFGLVLVWMPFGVLDGSVATYFFGGKAIGAGLLLGRLAFVLKSDSRRWIVSGIALFIVGLQCWTAVLEKLRAAVYGGTSILFQWIFYYLPLFVLVVLLLLSLELILRRYEQAAARLVVWSTAFACAAGVVSVVRLYQGLGNTPQLAKLGQTGGFLAIAMCWTAILHFSLVLHRRGAAVCPAPSDQVNSADRDA